MQSRRLVRRVVVAGVLFVTAGSVAFAQAVKDKRVQKLVEEEQQAVLKLVDGLEPGAPLPSDYAVRLAWDSFKASEQQTFLPVTIAFPAKEASPNGYTLYLQATRAGEAGKAQAEREAAEAKKRPTPRARPRSRPKT